jgi:hypothetical protein
MARLTRIPLAALFTWLVAATCFAQDGVITGRITDSSGAALPGGQRVVDRHVDHGRAFRRQR